MYNFLYFTPSLIIFCSKLAFGFRKSRNFNAIQIVRKKETEIERDLWYGDKTFNFVCLCAFVGPKMRWKSSDKLNRSHNSTFTLRLTVWQWQNGEKKILIDSNNLWLEVNKAHTHTYQKRPSNIIILIRLKEQSNASAFIITYIIIIRDFLYFIRINQKKTVSSCCQLKCNTFISFDKSIVFFFISQWDHHNIGILSSIHSTLQFNKGRYYHKEQNYNSYLYWTKTSPSLFMI